MGGKYVMEGPASRGMVRAPVCDRAAVRTLVFLCPRP